MDRHAPIESAEKDGSAGKLIAQLKNIKRFIIFSSVFDFFDSINNNRFHEKNER